MIFLYELDVSRNKEMVFIEKSCGCMVEKAIG